MLDRLRRPVSPSAYRTVTRAALVLLVFIVVTGAGVRLTGSGLGCTDWPNCTEDRFVAELEAHQLVEFVNRAITGLVSVVVVAAVLGSLRRAPRRRDLVALSCGLVAGVVAQIILGGVVVLSDLNPWLVQGHFVVSMLIVADAVVLAHRAGIPDDAVERPAVTPALMRWGQVLVAATALVLLTGTLVTGAGPHSGRESAAADASPAERLEAARAIRRLPMEPGDAARIHSLAVLAFLVASTWVLVQLRRHGADDALTRAGSSLVTVLVLQGALGYTQYFTGVPPLLVGLHVLGASLVWVAALNLLLRMRAPVVTTAPGPAQSAGVHDRPAHRTGGDLVPRR